MINKSSTGSQPLYFIAVVDSEQVRPVEMTPGASELKNPYHVERQA